MVVKVQECRNSGEEGSEERNKGSSWSKMVAHTGSHGLIIGCRNEHVPHSNTVCSKPKKHTHKTNVCLHIFVSEKVDMSSNYGGPQIIASI